MNPSTPREPTLYALERVTEIDLPQSRKRGYTDTDTYCKASQEDDLIHKAASMATDKAPTHVF